MQIKDEIINILGKVTRGGADYTGDNMFDDGILGSFQLVSLISELEDAFGIEISSEDIIEENFRNVDNIEKLIRKIIG